MTEHRASFRIVCDINEEFRVEVLDKTINHWYIVASKLGKGEEGYNKANEYCKEHQRRIHQREQHGIAEQPHPRTLEERTDTNKP